MKLEIEIDLDAAREAARVAAERAIAAQIKKMKIVVGNAVHDAVREEVARIVAEGIDGSALMQDVAVEVEKMQEHAGRLCREGLDEVNRRIAEAKDVIRRFDAEGAIINQVDTRIGWKLDRLVTEMQKR